MENEIQQLLSTKTASSKNKLLILLLDLAGKLADNSTALHARQLELERRLNGHVNVIEKLNDDIGNLYEAIMELQSKTGAAQC